MPEFDMSKGFGDGAFDHVWKNKSSAFSDSDGTERVVREIFLEKLNEYVTEFNKISMFSYTAKSNMRKEIEAFCVLDANGLISMVVNNLETKPPNLNIKWQIASLKLALLESEIGVIKGKHDEKMYEGNVSEVKNKLAAKVSRLENKEGVFEAEYNNRDHVKGTSGYHDKSELSNASYELKQARKELSIYEDYSSAKSLVLELTKAKNINQKPQVVTPAPALVSVLPSSIPVVVAAPVAVIASSAVTSDHLTPPPPVVAPTVVASGPDEDDEEWEEVVVTTPIDRSFFAKMLDKDDESDEYGEDNLSEQDAKAEQNRLALAALLQGATPPIPPIISPTSNVPNPVATLLSSLVNPAPVQTILGTISELDRTIDTIKEETAEDLIEYDQKESAPEEPIENWFDDLVPVQTTPVITPENKGPPVDPITPVPQEISQATHKQWQTVMASILRKPEVAASTNTGVPPILPISLKRSLDLVPVVLTPTLEAEKIAQVLGQTLNLQMLFDKIKKKFEGSPVDITQNDNGCTIKRKMADGSSPEKYHLNVTAKGEVSAPNAGQITNMEDKKLLAKQMVTAYIAANANQALPVSLDCADKDLNKLLKAELESEGYKNITEPSSKVASTAEKTVENTHAPH